MWPIHMVTDGVHACIIVSACMHACMHGVKVTCDVHSRDVTVKVSLAALAIRYKHREEDKHVSPHTVSLTISHKY